MFQPPTSFLLFRLLPPSHWIPGKCHQIPPIYVTIFACFIPMKNHHVLMKSHWKTSTKTGDICPIAWAAVRLVPPAWAPESTVLESDLKQRKIREGGTRNYAKDWRNLIQPPICCCLLLKSHGFPSFLGGCHPFFPMKSPYFSQLPVSAGASRVGDPSIRPWQQLAGLGLRAQWCECWGITPINGDWMVI